MEIFVMKCTRSGQDKEGYICNCVVISYALPSRMLQLGTLVLNIFSLYVQLLKVYNLNC